MFGGKIMQNNHIEYFLAANSSEGFVSQFENCYNPLDNWRAFIIKGGPGTGKSSFMKMVTKAAEENLEHAILCPCSSDPDSLDGVILPNKKVVILDGTAPHTLDPKYPAVCEEILNFGQFWDNKNLKDKQEIINITNENKALHRSASRYLRSIGELYFDNYKTAKSSTKTEKIEKFADSICKKVFQKNGKSPYEWVRFIECATPKGIISYPETITKTCENIIVFNDNYQAASNIFMQKIRQNALLNGYEIFTLRNPLLPSLIIDHIMIPSLSLAFVTEKKELKFETDCRKIHARRFTSSKLLHNSANRIKFNSKTIKILLNSACATLNKAKTVHDKLEKYYIDIMDFEALNNFTKEFCQKLFQSKNTTD